MGGKQEKSHIGKENKRPRNNSQIIGRWLFFFSPLSLSQSSTPDLRVPGLYQTRGEGNGKAKKEKEKEREKSRLGGSYGDQGRKVVVSAGGTSS